MPRKRRDIHRRGGIRRARPLPVASLACVLWAAPVYAAGDWDVLLQVNPVELPLAGETVSLKGYEWRCVDTEYFRLHYLKGVHPEHVRQVAERVDNIWRFLRHRSGVECDSRILVFMPLDRAAYSKLCKPFISRRRSGQFPSAQDFLSKSLIAVETHDYVDRLASIMYESTHLFRHTREERSRQDRGPWCWWSGEFMARYFDMGLRRTYAVLRPRQELLSMRYRDGVPQRWAMLEKLSARSVNPRHRNSQIQAAESVLHFLEQKYGEEQLTRFWRETLDAQTQKHTSTQSILEEVFGKKIEELEREWFGYYALGLPAWYLSLAQYEYGKGNRPRALALSTAILDVTPLNALRYTPWKRAWGIAGACFRKAGLQDEAESHYEAAAMIPHRWSLGLDLDPFGDHYPGRHATPPSQEPEFLPDDEHVLANLAMHYFRRGKADLGIRAYEKLSVGFPNSGRAPFYCMTLAKLCQRQKLPEREMAAYEAATRYPNSYHAMRAHVYLGRLLIKTATPESLPKAQAEARKHFETVLATTLTGPDAHHAHSVRRWAVRELTRLDKTRKTALRPLPKRTGVSTAQVVTYPRSPVGMAERISQTVGASPQQQAAIAEIVEKCRSLQVTTWASLARAGAERNVWLAVQVQLLAARRREVEEVLDESQTQELAIWTIERLPLSVNPAPLPRDDQTYRDCRADLAKWAEGWRREKLSDLVAMARLDGETADKLAPMLRKHRQETVALWQQTFKGRTLEAISKSQSSLDQQFESRVAKLIGDERMATFRTWWHEQGGQLEQYNGVVRHPARATREDL